MKTVLFVHDLQSSPSPRVQYLELAGFRVIALSSAQEGLRAVQQNRPDVVLTDVLVEGWNGFELCRELRKLVPAEELPIVMFSGIYRGPNYREEAVAVGVQEYLMCPVDLDEMLAAVHHFTAAGGESTAATG